MQVAAGGLVWSLGAQSSRNSRHRHRIESGRFPGPSISIPVTLSFFEKISGSSSTPTFNDLAG